MPSALEQAKRALIVVIRALAGSFSCPVSVDRNSADQDVHRAFRQLSRNVHPDKPGGSTAEFQKLTAAHDLWAQRLSQRAKAGRPARNTRASADSGSAAPGALPPVLLPERARGQHEFQVQSQAVLLTYQGVSSALPEALAWWERVLEFLEGRLCAWTVQRWTATMETNQDGKHHCHAMLEFRTRVHRTARYFAFEGACPNARANDLLGEAWSGRRWRVSVDRGHFYVWANKRGTVCGAHPMQ